MTDAPLVGYRIWHHKNDEHYVGLYPTGMFFSAGPWTDGVNTAQCMYQKAAYMAGYGSAPFFNFYGHGRAPDRTPHDAPLGKCTCGLYAYDSVATAQEHRRTTGWDDVPPYVLGAVLLWGDVVVGKVRDTKEQLENPGLRYRARYARIISMADEAGYMSADAAETAGVPLVPLDYLESYSREYGNEMRNAA